jgi:hypothetical protein
VEPLKPSVKAWEGQHVTTSARVVRPDDVALVQSDVSSVSVKVFDLSSNAPDTAIATLAPAVSSVIFNTLQNDGYWSLDGTGYNLRHTVAGSNFPRGGRTYRVEYEIVTASYGTFWVVTLVQAVPRRGG